MSNTQKIQVLFNNQMTEFVKQLISAFPDLKQDPEIDRLSALLRTTIAATPSVPITIFYEKIIKQYDSHIEYKDEKFFIGFDLSNTPMESLNYLKEVYIEASETNKKIIWNYIDRLRLLSCKYFEKNSEI